MGGKRWVIFLCRKGHVPDEYSPHLSSQEKQSKNYTHPPFIDPDSVNALWKINGIRTHWRVRLWVMSQMEEQRTSFFIGQDIYVLKHWALPHSCLRQIAAAQEIVRGQYKPCPLLSMQMNASVESRALEFSKTHVETRHCHSKSQFPFKTIGLYTECCTTSQVLIFLCIPILLKCC